MSDEDLKPTEPAIPVPLRIKQKHRQRAKRNPSSEPPPPSFDPGTEEFFRVGDSLPPEPVVVPAPPEAEPEPEVPPPPTRRNALLRVVVSAVALSVVLCLVAVVRTTSAASPPPRPSPTTALAVAPALAPAEAPSPALEELTPPTEEGPDALREEARALLAQHQLARAIELAQKATKAAPEDAEGWLILAAAQMEARKHADAAESFRSCVKVATQGPVAECRSFLR